ncbi:MAG: hypothetical protein OEZ19_05980 [Paracoccaceae bacterium]|nr:hypothetical protein [Paracoccaceae bacterium]
MCNDWIIDVLADLQSYASTNGMQALAEHLDQTANVAAMELAQQERQDPEITSIGHGLSGTNPRWATESQHS